MLLVSVHELFTAFFPPFDGRLDIAVHLVMMAGKLVVLAAIPAMLWRMDIAFHSRLKRFCAFYGASILLFAILTFIHAFWTREIFVTPASGDVVRYYYLESGPFDRFHYIGLEDWRVEWGSLVRQLKDK